MTANRFVLAGLFGCLTANVAQAQAGTEHIFEAPEGTQLEGVTVAPDKSMYAVLSAGGPHQQGTLIRLLPDGQVFVLHAFSATDSVGSRPDTAPVFGSDGFVYGTTSQGGRHGFGVLYRLDDCNEPQVLHDFTSEDGGPVVGPLLPAADGGFYAVTYGVYDENPNRDSYGEWAWIMRVPGKILYISSTGSVRALSRTLVQPSGGLISARDGYLYGTQPRIDVYRSGPIAWGYVYRIKPDGTGDDSSSWFNPLDFNPGGQVTEGPDGFIYGVSAGGFAEGPRVFRFGSAIGSRFGEEYREMAMDGSTAAGVAFGSDGNLYGAGTAFFRATMSGVVTYIHEIDGATPSPTAAMQNHPDGGFVVPSGDQLLHLQLAGGTQVLHRFGYRDGAELSELWQARDGRIYGTTNTGGDNSAGTLFRIESDGTLRTLVSWPGSTATTPWRTPRRSLFGSAPDGTVYGISQRDDYSLFSVSPAGELKTVLVFEASLAPYRYYNVGMQGVIGRDGALYGTLSSSEPGRYETQVFRVQPDTGELTVVARSADNNIHMLLSAQDGTLYAITATNNYNDRRFALVHITGAGSLTTLHTFPSDEAGHDPSGNLVEAADGSIYGYARARTNAGQNVIYRWASDTGFSIAATLSITETYTPKLGLARDGTLIGARTDPYGPRGMFIVRPSGELTVYPDPSLGTLLGNDGAIYRIEPISRNGYSGFRLASIELPN